MRKSNIYVILLSIQSNYVTHLLYMLLILGSNEILQSLLVDVTLHNRFSKKTQFQETNESPFTQKYVT